MNPLGPNTISKEAYDFIANLVYQHSRIRLGADKQTLVAGRLGKRLRQLGLHSMEEYCGLLESPQGEEEIGPLVDFISTNHTHFFREIQHFDFLRDHALPSWVPRLSRLGEPFRLWSAACSSGEEPYTAAIVMAEYARSHGMKQWQIEASDISTRILEKAQQGIYAADHVKVSQPEWLSRYFQKGTGNYEGYFRVKDVLRENMKFHRLNLLQPPYPVPAGQHCIFCRNVMIYFDHDTQQELVHSLTEQLAPGGYFIVGLSESLLGIKHSLKSVKPGIYRRN